MINNELVNNDLNNDEQEELLSILDEQSSSIVNKTLVLSAFILNTKLGKIIVICDNEKLYLLEFLNRKNFKKRILSLNHKLNAIIIEKKYNNWFWKTV